MMSKHLAHLYQQACLAELEAVKPGNVHLLADGHGLTVQDFINSAQASAPAIAAPNSGVGQRILAAAQATRQAVNTNTNLGIILLCAPIMQAALQSASASAVQPNGQPALAIDALRTQLQHVLNTLTVEDADLTYQAIRLMNPAGLGEQAEHDVKNTPQITLLQAMQAAADYDSIAAQYTHGFAAIFERGLPLYQQKLADWQRPAWASTALFLSYLSAMPDSHIARKYGTATAAEVQAHAQQHYDAFVMMENPKRYLPQLLAWDKQLKTQRINPGTSADLTVATLLIHALTKNA